VKKIFVFALLMLILTVHAALSDEEKTESDKSLIMEGIQITGKPIELSPLKTEVLYLYTGFYGIL